jgi:WD40 repeat protein
MRGHTAGVWGVAFSADGGLLASGSDDGTVKLWDISTSSLLRTLRPDRRYERADITGLTGVTEAQRTVLLALGAVERSR